jgi:hypothetical protein
VPPQIIGLQGEQANRSFPIADTPITFGRSPDNTVVLASGRASRRHAEIRRTGAEYILSDLGSANGTFVNGQRLTAPHSLRTGDTFQIGDDTFRFEGVAAVAAQPIPVMPPTVPVSPATPQFQPQQPQPQQPGPNGYIGTLPATPPVAAPPAKRGFGRTLLMVLGVSVLVLAVACIGGAVLIARSGPFGPASPTSSAARTPQPTGVASSNGDTGSNGEATPVPAGGDTWTVLVDLDGDNNLERDAINDFNEMEKAGSSDKVKILVQLDRVHQNGPEDDTSNGDWDTTKRFLVKQNDDPRKIGSEELDDLGEQNMGDPQTLVDFITWGVKTYPAQHYALVLWDHGSSWAGVAFDDSSEEKGISLPELDQALHTAQQQTGVEKLDLIGFDACLMAQIDVLQTIAPYGRTAVASAELEPNDGWAWDIWLKKLRDNSGQQPAAVATSIVDAYQQYYKDKNDDTVTLAAFNLDKIDAVREGLNTLSDAMIKDMNGSYQAIAEARSSVDAYSQPKPEEFNSVDLGDFARLVDRQGGESEVGSAAQSLGKLIDDARITEWHASFHDRSTGMSVFFPQVAELMPNFYEKASPTPQTTSWAKFLKDFHSAGGQQVSAPTITNLQLSSSTAGINNPSTLQGTVSGKDIAFIFFFAGIPNGDRSGVELTELHYVYPPGSSPNAEVPPWNDGDNALRETWNGTRWTLSNGTDTIPVLLGPTKYGTDLYGVEGVYTVKDTGEEISAGLMFTVNQGRAELQRIYGFPKSQKQEAQPFEITAQAGDTFTAYLRTYTIKDGRPVPDFNKGETITLGDTPLSAALAPANSGDYVEGFLVRDLSGHFSYEYVDVTIDNSGAGPNNPVPPAQQPNAGPGTQAGTLAYSSAEGRFALDYPDAWQTLDTGKSQIFFYDPAETSQTFVSVEYVAMKQQPSEANQKLVQAYIDILSKEQDFQHNDAKAVQLGGEDGLLFNYRYTDKNGHQLAGTAIAVTNSQSGLSYVITLQALASDYDGQTDTFNKVIDSFKME